MPNRTARAARRDEPHSLRARYVSVNPYHAHVPAVSKREQAQLTPTSGRICQDPRSLAALAAHGQRWAHKKKPRACSSKVSAIGLRVRKGMGDGVVGGPGGIKKGSTPVCTLAARGGEEGAHLESELVENWAKTQDSQLDTSSPLRRVHHIIVTRSADGSVRSRGGTSVIVDKSNEKPGFTEKPLK
ncbi:hypothetical protein B0H11DRAFT_1926578 [Mycena galericulata]|nr:hypothetical protein B0H11DRAFT_1926578 [Mycena galericulata]